MCTLYWPDGIDYTLSAGPPDPMPPCDPERIDCGQPDCPTSSAYTPPAPPDHALPETIMICLRSR